MRHRANSSTDSLADDGSDQPIDLARLAKIIADGEVPFPDDLSPEESLRLAIEVRHQRRDQLVRFLARQVAFKLYNLSSDKLGDANHAPSQF